MQWRKVWGYVNNLKLVLPNHNTTVNSETEKISASASLGPSHRFMKQMNVYLTSNDFGCVQQFG